MIKSQTLLQIIATSTKLLRRNKFRVKMIMQNAKWKIPRRSRPVQLLLSPLYIEITTTTLFQGVLTNPFLCFNLSFSLPYCCTLFGRMDRLDRTMWFKILLLSILPLICSFMQMEFMKKSTGLISVCLSLPLYFFSTILPCIVGYYYVGWRSESDAPELKKLFQGHKRTGKIIGALFLSFGNVGLDYFTEKSVACMLTFLFLAVYFLSILCCIQPCTDFGILELLLSASSIVALRRFGVLHFNSWLVVLACLLIDVIRYLLDPESEHQVPSGQLPSAAVEGSGHSSQTLNIVASNGTEENQDSMSETSNGFEEFDISLSIPLSMHCREETEEDQEIAKEGYVDYFDFWRSPLPEGEETLTSIRNPNIGGGGSIGVIPIGYSMSFSVSETEEDQEIAKVGEEIANEGEETEEDQEIANAGEETEEGQDLSMTETANAGKETLPSIRNPNIGEDGPIRAPIQASRPRKRRVLPETSQFK